MRLRYIVAGVATILGTVSAIAACSLDLDESLIDRNKDGGVVFVGDVQVPEGAVVTESGVVEPPTASTCTKDQECVSANGCLKGRCDLVRRSCAFDVCRTATCTGGKCDETTRACGPPTTYKLKAATFPIAQPILCGGCLVAAYPWVFVGTQQGLLAYNASNPASEAPALVPVVGVGFVPTRMTRSGNRIWLAGNSVGPAGGPVRVPLAFLDVPSDPFTPTLRAQTVLVEYKRPPEGEPRLFPRDNKTLLLVGAAPSFASAVVDTNLVEPASVSPSPFAPPADTDVFAISGTRVITMTTAAGAPSVNLVSNVGGGAATVEKAVPLDIGDTSLTRVFGWASSIDGIVFWAGAANTSAGPAPAPVVTRAIRGFFLTADGTSAIPEKPDGTDIEVYTAGGLGGNADSVRFPVLLDSNTAMVATSAKDDLAKTAVNFVTRSPLAVKTDKRVVIPAPISAIVASSSSAGIGYLGANEQAPNDAGPPVLGKVYVFDPACDP